MLSTDEAKKRLESFKSKSHAVDRLARIADLPEALRPDVRALFRLEPAASPEAEISHWEREQQRRARAVAAYRAIPPAALENAVRAVYPELAPFILRALKDSVRLPYTSGYARKPFRSPSIPAVLDPSRMLFLSTLIEQLAEYSPDVEWIAAWAPHAWPYDGGFVARLLAAAIDEGGTKGQAVFDTLIASAKGEHEVGQMGRHVIGSLLTASRPGGWEFIEKLLIAAQREEGLRQSILEAVDECHPDAFIRFLRVVLEHDIVRFSATVRAVDVWFGFLWDAMSAAKARQIIEQALNFLEDPTCADAAILAAVDLPPNPKAKTAGKKLNESDERIEAAYIALWTKAFLDVGSAFAPAHQMLKSANAEVRFVATHLLCQLQLVGAVSNSIASMLDDPEERVAARALMHFGHNAHYSGGVGEPGHPEDLFERIEKLLARAPAKSLVLSPIVWPWMRLNWGKEQAGVALVSALGQRLPTRLLPHLEHFDARTRYLAAERLGQLQVWDDPTRKTLFAMVADPSRDVRQAALKHLAKCTLAASEAIALEQLLTRKASDLRRAVIMLLLSQPDADVLASVDRLTASKSELPRLAGLELMRELASAARVADAVRNRASQFRTGRSSLSVDEQVQLDAICVDDKPPLTLDDCLGLIDPGQRTAPPKPRPRKVDYSSARAVGMLRSLDELVHQNRERSFTPINYHGEAKEDVLLGNVRWEFPHLDSKKPVESQLDHLPFKEIWFEWFDRQPRDQNNRALLQALWLKTDERPAYFLTVKRSDWMEGLSSQLSGGETVKLRYPNVVGLVLEWLVALHPPRNTSDFLLDGLENILSAIPPDKLAVIRKREYGSSSEVVWRERDSRIMEWAQFAGRFCDAWPADAKVRFYQLLCWIDEPGVPIGRHRPDLSYLLRAVKAGGASEADIYDHFLGPRGVEHYSSGFRELGEHFTLRKTDEAERDPVVDKIVDRCRSRVLEVELTRGEKPTLVSMAALALRHSGGLDVLARFLRAAEKNTFSRGYSGSNESKATVFSHVIRATYPADTDTPAAFATAMKQAAISEDRLLELAVYAPQWADHVTEVLKWRDLSEAVWWIHAHTRDRGWSVEASLQER